MRATLDTRLRTLLARDPGTRLGADPEELHQMQVPVRRMRAALKAARPLLDRAWADDLRAELGWLVRALGPARDADVLIERLRDRAATFDDTSRAAVETLIEALLADRETLTPRCWPPGAVTANVLAPVTDQTSVPEKTATRVA